MKLGEHKIQSITLPGGEIDTGLVYAVNKWGVTEISVQYADGQMAEVPWFSIWKGPTRLWKRINAAHVESVEYA